MLNPSDFQVTNLLRLRVICLFVFISCSFNSVYLTCELHLHEFLGLIWYHPFVLLENGPLNRPSHMTPGEGEDTGPSSCICKGLRKAQL